jgi:hypothetical protein
MGIDGDPEATFGDELEFTEFLMTFAKKLQFSLQFSFKLLSF